MSLQMLGAPNCAASNRTLICHKDPNHGRVTPFSASQSSYMIFLQENNPIHHFYIVIKTSERVAAVLNKGKNMQVV